MIHSGMDFIEDNLFDIENYSKKFDGIRTVEFVRVIDNKYVFIEAKKSIAKFENKLDFNKNIEEITGKFIHSLYVLSSVKLGINETSFDISNFNGKKIKFILVINAEWAKNINNIADILDNIRQKIPNYINKIFKPEILVYNKDIACRLKLVKAEILETV
jgi:hypothetical protein